MSIVLDADGTVLHLSPATRGAPDQVRPVLESVIGAGGDLLVASQQAAERGVVDRIVAAAASSRRRPKVLIEAKYLAEASAVDPIEVWDPIGRFEENRQCALALWRGGADLRLDSMGSDLQHANLLVSKGDDVISVVTSANIAPGSITSHYNWLLETRRSDVAEALTDLFDAAWDGDFSDASTSVVDAGLILAAGGSGEALDLLRSNVAEAEHSVTFAFFNISASSDVVAEMIAAHERGVEVRGVVDGDQSNQPWDAVPVLRDAGLDVRYYPGALTGAAGRRMHYKMATIDDVRCFLGTANLSSSAESSLELGLVVHSAEAAGFVRAEIDRLWPLARTQPIAVAMRR